MKIGLTCNLLKIRSLDVISEFMQFLDKNGYNPVFFHDNNSIDGVDVVIVLGGDGAILHAAVVAAKKGIKIIGINHGNLGFLTEFEKEDANKIIELLDSIKNGTCNILKRTLLKISVKDKVYYALNEVSIQRQCGIGKQVIKLDIDINNKEKTNIRGDGVLICTPTGSTAYSLSAGGAIVYPSANVFMMTPICPFSLNNRPIVFPDTDIFNLSLSGGTAILLVDGRVVTQINDELPIKVEKAEFTADFPKNGDYSFLERIKNKLN